MKTKKDHLTTLKEVLLSAEKLPMDGRLFMLANAKWTLDTACAVLRVDPYAQTDNPPAFVQEHGLCYAMQIPQVQDVVINARLQRNKLAPAMLLKAFLFYHDKDAFIDFDAESHHA